MPRKARLTPEAKKKVVKLCTLKAIVRKMMEQTNTNLKPTRQVCMHTHRIRKRVRLVVTLPHLLQAPIQRFYKCHLLPSASNLVRTASHLCTIGQTAAVTRGCTPRPHPRRRARTSSGRCRLLQSSSNHQRTPSLPCTIGRTAVATHDCTPHPLL